MAYRLEILFVGPAPEDELARARLLGSEAVQKAIANLGSVLAESGFDHDIKVQTVRSTPRQPKVGQRPIAARKIGEAAE